MASNNHFGFKLVLLTLVVLVQCIKAQDNFVVVDVPELGFIRGIRVNNTAGVYREYVRFTGIPYAKSPAGEDRFFPAQETGLLAGAGQEFDATQEGESCVQSSGFSIFNPESQDLALEYGLTRDDRIPENYEEKIRQSKRASVGSEDCLNLNIHTPDVTGKLPVIVFIHGGAFTSGNGILYGPGKFFKHDVILVTINYRLGALGFFSLETNEAPGNAALYDMLGALRWVSNYIQHFGGDPDKVTAMGQSAGGAGLSHLMLSPLSFNPKPLFHRAIILSASALLPWATIDSPVPASLRIAELAECYDPNDGTSADYAAIIQCMKYVDADILVTAMNIYQAEERKAGRLGVDAVSPVIQKAGEPKLIAKRPIDVLNSGEQMNIPLMMGSTRHEGSFPLGIVYNRFLNCATCGALHNNATFLRRNLVPALLEAMGVHDDSGAVHDALADKYLGDRRDSGNFTMMTPGLLDIHSVFFFKSGAYKFLELHAQKNPDSYWYAFDHMGQYTLFPLLFPAPLPFKGGIAHGDDLMYLFHFFTLNEADQSVSDGLVDYYRNFAYTGNPNIAPSGTAKSETNALVEWPAFDGTSRYLVVNKEFTVHDDYMSTWADASLELEPPPVTTTTTPAPTTTTTTLPPTTTTTQTSTTTENNDSSKISSGQILLIFTILLIWVNV